MLVPIRLHVDAKRYLCATDTGYWASLSEDSKRSLELQGGTATLRSMRRNLLRNLYAEDAVKLRRWDDLAKVAGIKTPDLAHFLEFAARCVA